MARRSKTALLSALCVAISIANASAQTRLPRLHVTSLSLRADTLRPQVEKPFHLIIAAHFKETLTNADFVRLPNLAELEDLGDERHTLSAHSGTDFSETIAVVAHRSGTLRVEPAYFNAIDARDGKPKTFSSNDLVLSVAGPLEDPLARVRYAAGLLLKMLAILAAVFVIAAILFRRRARTLAPTPAPHVSPAQAPVRSAKDLVREQLLALRADPGRRKVLEVRRVLWERTGAREVDTLSDVLGKLRTSGAWGETSNGAAAMFRLTERAAFIQEAGLHGAIDDMILALEQYCA